MNQTTSHRKILVALIVVPTALWMGNLARAGSEGTASKSLTIQPSGARSGRPGDVYFNVEGKRNGADGKFASFGVLVFPAKSLEGTDIKTAGLTLDLVQTIVSFSKEGKLKIYLPTSEFDAGPLKFDAAGTDGLAAQIKSKHLLGQGEFKKGETGKVDSFALTLDDEARKVLSERIAKNQEIFLLVVPDDDDVAATYFGAGQEDPTKRPCLRVGPKG